MNRFHLHLAVADLGASVRFYTALFGSAPAVEKADYAKWLLDDPAVNFAISTNSGAVGIEHLGIQAGDAGALAALGERLDAAGGTVVPEEATVCCYARSDKFWTEDPQGTKWETFHTFGEATTYHEASAACATDGVACTPDFDRAAPPVAASTGSCCAPASNCC
jgi:catechol 2,3-dioxygenase-like lactoylglutathione lyase family enzyme